MKPAKAGSNSFAVVVVNAAAASSVPKSVLVGYSDTTNFWIYRGRGGGGGREMRAREKQPRRMRRRRRLEAAADAAAAAASNREMG